VSATFPGEVEAAAVRVHLYFVKILGCKLLADGIAVNLRSFATALLERRPHPEVTLLVANSIVPAGQIISYNSDVSVLRPRGRSLQRRVDVSRASGGDQGLLFEGRHACAGT